jgi:hypothetical protein
MALIKKCKSSLLRGMHGQIGKFFVIRQCRNGIVLAKFPEKSSVKPTARQEQAKMRFKEAVEYAKSIQYDPVKYEAYKKKLKRNQTVFTMAVAEYLTTVKK